MTVSSSDYLKGLYNATRAVGNKAINSDAYFEIEGFERLGLLTKQFPWPVLSIGGEIESASAAGPMWTPQNLKTNKQGQVTFTETVTGLIQSGLNEIIVKKGGIFNATVYEGKSPDRFYRAYKIRDCFLQIDDADRDWENISQVMTLSGTLFYHFFGETIPGNILPL